VPIAAGAHKVRFEYFAHWSWGGPTVKAGIIRPETMISDAAKKLASSSDVVVLAVGFDPDSETEGADRTFLLPPAQDELINQIAATNKNTIVAITSGGAVDMTSWIDHVPAIYETWYAGEQGGTALAQLLFGDYSPSGKLPVSFERHWEDNPAYASYYPKTGDRKVSYTEGIFEGYRYYDKSQTKPLFPFGYGLSYTTFAYKNLSVTPTSVSGDQPVTVSFDVTNTGSRAGAEVAEVYVAQPNSRIPRPIKELKGFTKVLLNPGETRNVTVTLDRRAFSYYDAKIHDWAADSGEFNVIVGSSSAKAELTSKLTRQ